MQGYQAFINGILVIVLIIPFYAIADTDSQKSCISPSKSEVVSFFNQWNHSLQTGNPDKVLENYAEGAVLLPTLSDIPRITHTQIKDYFVSFLEKHPIAQIDQQVIKSGCNWATDTGLYTFEITESGKKKYVKARYSFVYENINGQWLIIHQHSSLLPESKSIGF